MAGTSSEDIPGVAVAGVGIARSRSGLQLTQHNPSEALEMPTNPPAQSDHRGAERRDRTEHPEVARSLNVTPPPRHIEQPEK
jgi:hypothetical protein